MLYFSGMKKIVIVVLYYAVACFLVLSIGQFVATNMEGTHFDTIVYLMVPLMSIALLVKSILKVRTADRASRWVLAIHVAGLVLVGLLVYHAWMARG